MSLTSVELVAIAHPVQAGFWYIVESYKIVVAWYAVDGAYANFGQSLEEILPYS